MKASRLIEVLQREMEKQRADVEVYLAAPEGNGGRYDMVAEVRAYDQGRDHGGSVHLVPPGVEPFAGWHESRTTVYGR